MLAVFPSLLFAACSGSPQPIGPSHLVEDTAGGTDMDGDGYRSSSDCDDTDPAIHPGAEEHCDGVDENCDHQVDEAAVDAPTWYADADADGYGDPGAPVSSCDAPAGTVEDDTDCDDSNPAIHPGAEELCNGLDDDCDGETDQSQDADEDGWEGVCGGDCDDSNPAVHPGATELCNGLDDDCDGETDIGAADAPTWYADADADGYGLDTDTMVECEAGDGWAPQGGDCDDSDPAINPGAEEICNDGVDNDCDGGPGGCTWSGTESLSAADGVVYGNVPEAYAGYSVASAGDQDGDGLVDLLVGATNESNSAGTQAGATYLVLSPLVGSIAVSSADAALLGTDTQTWAGRRVASCDLDGDGLPELVAGAWGDSQVGSKAGAVYIYPGGISGTSGPDIALLGVAAGDQTGWDVACAGDIDGDGNEDLLAGAPAYDGPGGVDSGAVFVVPGPVADNGGLAEAASTMFTGEAGGDLAGGNVAGTGDLDGDGLPDLAIGAVYQDAGGSNAGAVYVVHAPLSAGTISLADADAKLVGEEANDNVQAAVAGGDLDGDGLPDLVVSAPQRDGGGIDRGAVYVLPGSVSGVTDLSTAPIELQGEADYDHAGAAIAGPGDIDGDGFDDLAVGAYGSDISGTDAGAVYIFYGPLSSGTVMASADAVLTGVAAGDLAGWALAPAGDTDADGYADLLVGAKYESTGGSQAGAAYLVLGRGL